MVILFTSQLGDMTLKSLPAGDEDDDDDDDLDDDKCPTLLTYT